MKNVFGQMADQLERSMGEDPIKEYLYNQGATELAERIKEITNQKNLKVLIDNLVDHYEKKYGRLFK